MANVISPTDLFSDNFETSINSTISALESAVSRTEAAMGRIAQQAEKMKEVTKKPIDPAGAKEVQYLADQYRYLLRQFNLYKDSVGELTTVQRDQNAIIKLSQDYANAMTGSYNKLSAEYRLLKISANAMSAEWLANTEAGKALVARLDELHAAMNDYQKSTGKYTLQVGNYERAMNGLALSTQQVLREMPTLANSVSQFFIAISNNIPIFTDNLMRARQEMGSWKAALGAVAKSVFSWQTALLVLLTVLPKVAKNIHDKKKATEGDIEETKKAIKYETLLKNVLRQQVDEQAKSTSSLRIYSDILKDTNRSIEDRIGAGNELKKLFKDELDGYTAEEIAMGNASVAINKITESLKAQAKVRVLVKQLQDLMTQQAPYEDILATVGIQEAVIKEGYNYDKSRFSTIQAISQYIDELEAKGFTQDAINAFVAGFGRNTQKALQEFRNAKSEFDKFQKSIDGLEGKIDTFTSGLETDATDAKETVKDLSDYSFEVEEALLANLEDSLDKRLLLNDLAHRKELAARQKQQDEILAIIHSTDAKITEAQKAEAQKQLDNLNQIIAAEQVAFQRSQTEIVDKYISGFTVSAVDESITGDFTSIFDRLRSQIAEAGNQMQAAYQSILTNLAKGNRAEAKQESKDFKAAAMEKLEAERDLQIELLNLRRDTTGMTEAEYQIEFNKIQETFNKGADKLTKTRKTRKFSIWTLLFGTDKVDSSTGDIVRELDQETEFAVNQLVESFKTSISYAQEYISVLQEVAQAAVDAANTQVEAAKTTLDYEMQARANGYANNVEYARKEYEEKLALQEQAVAEQERLQKIQNAIDTATQTSSLITATASLLASYSAIPYVGLPLAIAAIALMWGTFAAAKIKAAQVAGTTTYGEGMGEYLDYGGSHASGNDIDFGTSKDGKRRRVERGEVIGVINKKNVRKYGPDEVLGIIDSLNKGTFEDTYGSAFAGVTLLAGQNSADLGRLETGVDTLVKQGEYREAMVGGKRIIQYKNLRRVITNA